MFPLLSHVDKVMMCVYVSHHPITNQPSHHPITKQVFLTWSRRCSPLSNSTAVTVGCGHWPVLLSEVSHSAFQVIKNQKDPSILHLPLQPCSTSPWTSPAQPMIVFVSIKATVGNMSTSNPLTREDKMPQIILTWVLKSNDLRGVCVNKMSVAAHANFIERSWIHDT
jgi:hypothetical protein